MKDETLEVLKFALSAYDAANTHAMRLWYAASLISVPVLTTAAGVNALPIEGFSFNAGEALPILLLILAVLNFVFVVAQISHYRMAFIFSSMVNEQFKKTDLVSKGVTWRDLLLSARIAGYNRVMPVLEHFGMNGDWVSTKMLKSAVDIIFGLFPAVSLVVGLLILPSSSPLYLLTNVVGLVSLLTSLPIIGHTLKWAKEFVSS